MQNGTIIQFFHWYYPQGGLLWKEFSEKVPALSQMGITAAWLPPPTKASTGGYSVGYDIYDLFDLGEFDQKGTVATKYGTKEEYIAAIDTAHQHNIKIFIDTVLNHKSGGDETENIHAIKVNPENRSEYISDEIEIKAFTKFTFSGRCGKYSPFIWDYNCFTGTDYNDNGNENGIFKILNEYTNDGWENVPTLEKGNYDYLMFTDIEFRNPAVREEIKHWAKWVYETTKIDGFRLDAIKHITHTFFIEWIDYIKENVKDDLFFLGECWSRSDWEMLNYYLTVTEGRMHLFDSLLQFNFYIASKAGRDYDLTKIFDNTILKSHPNLTVTLVDNHDTQPLQQLESVVEGWFKAIAYSIILLREAGYPCVFYPDLYGAEYKDHGKDGNEYEITLLPCGELEKLLLLRKNNAYGLQRDYIDHANCIGWTREGTDEYNNSGCAVILSNGEDGFKDMEVGKCHAGKRFTDFLQKRKEEVIINEEGWGKFYTTGGSVSVWVP